MARVVKYLGCNQGTEKYAVSITIETYDIIFGYVSCYTGNEDIFKNISTGDLLEVWLFQGKHLGGFLFCIMMNFIVHRSTKQTPKKRYESNQENCRFIPAEMLREFFLWEEDRTVRKTAVIEIDGNLYDVDSSLRRKRIQIRYNTFDLSYIQIWYDGQRFNGAKPAELRNQSHSKLLNEYVDDSSPAFVSNYLELLKQRQEEEKQATWHNYLCATERKIKRGSCLMLEFFEINDVPFTREISPSQLFASSSHKKASARLEYSARHRQFRLLTGEAGMGKSTGNIALIHQLDSIHYRYLYICDYALTSKLFYRAALQEFWHTACLSVNRCENTVLDTKA
jgi:hypothetical protein